MNKSKEFQGNQKELARFAWVISHPARLAILQYQAETKTCISGDISDCLCLSSRSVNSISNMEKLQGLFSNVLSQDFVNE